MLARITAICLGLIMSLAMHAASAEVIVVVSAHNPLDSLSHDRLNDIYLGRSNRFPNGDAAIPVDQTEQSSARDAFYHDYLHRSPAQMRTHWSKLIFTGRGQPPRALADDAAVADLIAGNPNAIGYINAVHLDGRLKQVTIE